MNPATRPDHLTSVVQLRRDALLNPLTAPMVLEGAVEDAITQMARAQGVPGAVDWGTFRLRVERTDPAPEGLDTELRVRATVDVTP